MNFRQVRKKIKTVGNVKQITKAMQMVASVKMKKATDAALVGNFYRDHLERVLRRVVARANRRELSYVEAEPNSSDRKLYILITSNKGLCGSFNLGITKMSLEHINFGQSDFISMGKKGSDFLVKMKAHIIADFSQQLPFANNTSAVFSDMSRLFLAGDYNEVYLVYNKFISTIKYEPFIRRLLPVKKIQFGPTDDKTEVEKDQQQSSVDYLIEPSPEAVLQALIVDYLKDAIRGAVLDSEAAEHSARMIAMKNATDAATDLIYNLTLVRNKIRQTSITNELLDITTAKESTTV